MAFLPFNPGRDKFSNDAERLCGILKTDRIMPTYTLCLYHGKELWDGPRSLKDMMDFGKDREVWEEIFVNYHFHLVCINEQTDFKKYHSSLRELFQLISKRDDKQALDDLAEESRREGKREGLRSGIIAFLELCQEVGMNREAATERLAQKFGFEKSVAEKNVAKYWK